MWDVIIPPYPNFIEEEEDNKVTNDFFKVFFAINDSRHIYAD